MATYKLIQDIEAEDHILGPLSLRQFIFALIACFFGYFDFLVASKGVPFLLILFAPPTLFFAFFAFPFGKDQPTEIWFLAKLRYWFLPRKRIWDQSGMKELVTITAPKKIEKVLTDGLSQNEVKSRLNALASTIDSRGWAIKNVGVYASPAMGGDPDRLIDLNSIPQDVPSYDLPDSSDMLDTNSNPVAQQMAAMVDQSAQQHHDRLVQEINAAAAQPAPASRTGWFMGQGAAALSAPAVPYQAAPAAYAPPSAPAPSPAPTPPASFTPPPATPSADEAELTRELRLHTDAQDLANSHLHTLVPGGSQGTPAAQTEAAPTLAPPPSPPVTTPSDPAILALASNNDLNVETLAREANKAKTKDDQQPNEVVISLR